MELTLQQIELLKAFGGITLVAGTYLTIGVAVYYAFIAIAKKVLI